MRIIDRPLRREDEDDVNEEASAESPSSPPRGEEDTDKGGAPFSSKTRGLDLQQFPIAFNNKARATMKKKKKKKKKKKRIKVYFPLS